MKKICILLLCATMSLFADWDINGEIIAIDNQAKTITLGGWGSSVVVKVLPHTRMEGDDCGWFGLWDSNGSFKDLYIGQLVEVDVLQGYVPPQGMQDPNTIPQIPQVTARKIEWKCYGNRAY
ncbi:hypothetical protein CCZ01_02495 [Helicobacter monodelphidis]|uniref:hypothetical protein n=1 Tax=Helicobacter sp. 15-1451 TaxID=2004995 RepID=UPI000DCC4514|nr:hypothetical protein [Helicobacter sp. 15-1451]RAX58670.1 hypothetical protein CCZ01_02495 [Helicobacter sp. 15-1451]